MTFSAAVKIVLRHEGGYVNHPQDPGGETNYGISKRSYPLLDIKNLTVQQAESIYYKDYWLAGKCDKLPSGLAIIFFDMCVNMGIARATKLLQKSMDVVQDGAIGPITIARSYASDFRGPLTTQRILYYTRLQNFSVFGGGWTRRSIETLVEAMRA